MVLDNFSDPPSFGLTKFEPMGFLQGNSGGGGSGRSGCVLMLAALGVFLTVIVVAIWSLISQDREISKFTQDDPAPVPVAGNVPQEEVDALRAKLDGFAEAAEAGEAATLQLSIHELNLIIAHTESAKDYREMIYFTGTRQIRGGGAEEDQVKVTQGKQLVAKVCLKMNKLKFWGDRIPFLPPSSDIDPPKISACSSSSKFAMCLAIYGKRRPSMTHNHKALRIACRNSS